MIKSQTTLTVALAMSFMLGLFSSTPANAQETYIDSTCKQNQQLDEFDRFTVMYKSEFQTKGQTYWFYSGQYIDATPIVCISQPGFQQAKPLNIKQIQLGYIDKISKDPNNQTGFLVTIRDGNGSYVPITQYRLNLSTPEKPVITKLRSWRSGR
ncbi:MULTISPECIES: hypothetical protein [unclassified Nodularia (in: cyanobacteria)]|uniref:hypothetical protein n=1 Tax=unclassified Nodularia (in: cyanobacteria) TaxID=2656917 RepID=UPI00187DE265|nr:MULTISPECIES: hypothetical protein [unclassified Nodularia (in: cyanobacteria)]MBE9199428.1 hypothetical protein [Nodularia sp. LEGE 06071]MCC2692926.1 hypothetical protein [Nodularia sp. LEGE 04288]